MPVTFIHTADWQIGKPYRTIDDERKRVALQDARIQAIEKIGQIAEGKKASFVVVAGDLFDSFFPVHSIVSATCRAIGAINIPFFVIPGNHDHGAEGSIWTSDFFKKEKADLASNLHVLLRPEPVTLEDAIIFPCPLLRNKESADLTAWVREIDVSTLDPQKPRIILAHGTVIDFDNFSDSDTVSANKIDYKRINANFYDYIALGDWHGAKKISEKCWYSGTPEQDRFSKGEDYNAGNVLVVRAERNAEPRVEIVNSGKVNWHIYEKNLTADEQMETLETELNTLMGNEINKDRLKLILTGSLGLVAQKKLDELITKYNSRIIKVDFENKIIVTPTKEELESLITNNENPLMAAVAKTLHDKMQSNGPEADVAAIALRELYLIMNHQN